MGPSCRLHHRESSWRPGRFAGLALALGLVAPLAACSGEADGREKAGPGGPDGTGGTGGVPAPVIHAPPEPLSVDLLGPELDAPVDVRDLAVGPGGGIWLVGDGGLHVRAAGGVFFEAVPGAGSVTGAPPASVAALDATAAVVGYPDGPAHLVTLATSGSPFLDRLPLEGPIPRLAAASVGSSRMVLAGTAGGLARIAASSAVAGPGALPAPSSAIWSVTAAGADVWVGDEHRAARFSGALLGPLEDAPLREVDLVPGESDWVVALAVCPSGELWASALGSGVYRLSSSGEVLEHLTAAAVLPQDHVLSLACDLDGSVWFGTSWGGLARRLRDGTFRYHARTAGLPGDSIRRLLLVPDGTGGRTLWMATEGGAAAYTGP